MRSIVVKNLPREVIIAETVKALHVGQVVVFPSDTVYGLLVDARNPSAVDRLLRFKDRPPGKAVSVFVDGFEMMHQYAHLDHRQQKQLELILPGPYTVVLDSRHQIDQRLESEKETVGLRYIQHDLVNELVRTFGGPITATSANKGGASPHYRISSLLGSLSVAKQKELGLVVDAGVLPRNAPSTVVDYTADRIEVLRAGDATAQQSRKVLSSSEDETMAVAAELVTSMIDQEDKTHLVMLCSGDLGAGKTRFAGGIARGLGITEQIVSPTFVVTYSYQVPSPHRFHEFHHFDLYAVTDVEEFAHLGVEKMKQQPGIFCIEWGERIGSYLPTLADDAKVVHVHLEHAGPEARQITITQTD